MSLTVEQMEEQVKEIGGKIATYFLEKGSVTYYIFIDGYPSIFEFYVKSSIPIANVELGPCFRVEELERVIRIKKEIIRLTDLLAKGYLINENNS